jgi:hypothetical protein
VAGFEPADLRVMSPTIFVWKRRLSAASQSGARPRVGGEICLVAALRNMSNPQQSSPVAREALDEFIRQLFECHWVLAQMIAGMIERAQSEHRPTDQEAPDAYALIRNAIGEVARRHGTQEIGASTRLIDEVMEAVSADGQIFPTDTAVTNLLADREPRRRRVRQRRPWIGDEVVPGAEGRRDMTRSGRAQSAVRSSTSGPPRARAPLSKVISRTS